MSVISNLSPKVLYVSQDSTSKYNSISDAIKDTNPGDQIIVGPGNYSPETTNEKFPIYLPPRCQLIGLDAKQCKINGENAPLKPSSRPVDPNQSLLLLGDHTSVSNLMFCNSGANGISNEQGSHFFVSDCILQDNGQHGMLIFGANQAIIQNNKFENNGILETLFKAPNASTGGKQGHQIFIEGRVGSKNNIAIVGNTLQKVFADGIDIDVFDQPDGMKMSVSVIGNHISNCGRFGFALCGSYGPSSSNIFLDIRNNEIIDADTGIDFQSAFSLIHKIIHNSNMFINIVSNSIKNCTYGITAFGAISPALNCQVQCNLIGNRFSYIKKNGLSIFGGVGLHDWPIKNSSCYATISNNSFEHIEEIPIFAQGGISSNNSQSDLVQNNLLFVHIINNKLNDSGKIVVNDGHPTNTVNVLENSQEYERKTDTIPFTIF